MWSPDGRKFLYTTEVGREGTDVWIMNRDGPTEFASCARHISPESPGSLDKED